MEYLEKLAQIEAKKLGGTVEGFRRQTEPDGTESLVILVDCGIGGIKKTIVNGIGGSGTLPYEPPVPAPAPAVAPIPEPEAEAIEPEPAPEVEALETPVVPEPKAKPKGKTAAKGKKVTPEPIPEPEAEAMEPTDESA
jgi:hypothetical protein